MKFVWYIDQNYFRVTSNESGIFGADRKLLLTRQGRVGQAYDATFAEKFHYHHKYQTLFFALEN